MVVGKAVNNLKERPKEERTAVATGVAGFVVLVLLIGWALIFFKKVQRGVPVENLRGGVPQEFNFSSVKEAQDAVLKEYEEAADVLRQAREAAVSGETGSTVEPETQSSDMYDQFGFPIQ